MYVSPYSNPLLTAFGVSQAIKSARERRAFDGSLVLDKPKLRVEQEMGLHGYTMGLYLAAAEAKIIGKSKFHGGEFRLTENSSGNEQLRTLTEEFQQALVLDIPKGKLGTGKTKRAIEEAKNKCKAIGEKHGIRVHVVFCEEVVRRTVRPIAGVVWGNKGSSPASFVPEPIINNVLNQAPPGKPNQAPPAPVSDNTPGQATKGTPSNIC